MEEANEVRDANEKGEHILIKKRFVGLNFNFYVSNLKDIKMFFNKEKNIQILIKGENYKMLLKISFNTLNKKFLIKTSYFV